MVLNCQFRGPKKKRVPKWMRVYVIGYLGRIFCFAHESRAFYEVKEEGVVVKTHDWVRCEEKSRGNLSMDESDVMPSFKTKSCRNNASTDSINETIQESIKSPGMLAILIKSVKISS